MQPFSGLAQCNPDSPTKPRAKRAKRAKHQLPDGLDQYLTLKDIAVSGSTTERTVRRWISKGELPASKLGGLTRVKRSDYDRFITPIPAATDTYSDSAA